MSPVKAHNRASTPLDSGVRTIAVAVVCAKLKSLAWSNKLGLLGSYFFDARCARRISVFCVIFRAAQNGLKIPAQPFRLHRVKKGYPVTWRRE